MKKIITLALIAAMMLTMIVVGTSAAAWDGTTASTALEGDGSAATPYLVKSAEDLAFLAKSVDEGTTYAGKYITQTADIDLGNKVFPTIGNDGKQFQGVYDGKGFKITNFNCVASEFDSGLFARVNSTAEFQAAILNVVLEGSISELTYTNAGADQNVGALVGKLVGNDAKPAIVANCVVDVDVNIEKTLDSSSKILYVGGIIGYAMNSQVVNCVNKSDMRVVISSKHLFVGGVIGQSYYAMNVEGCANYGDIFAEDTTAGRMVLAGAMIGRTNGKAGTAYLLKNNVNYGDINAKAVGAAYASGGIAQEFNSATENITVDSCANLGKVHAETSTEGQNAYAGGILAYENVGSTTVKNCAGLGEVTAAGVNKTMLPGYIVGVSNPGENQKDSSVKDCVATGKANGWFGAKAKAENCTSDAEKYTVECAVYEMEKAAFEAARTTVNGTVYSYSAKAVAEPVAPTAPETTAPETTAPTAPETTAPSTPSTPSTPNTGDVTSVILLALVAACAGAVITIKKTK